MIDLFKIVATLIVFFSVASFIDPVMREWYYVAMLRLFPLREYTGKGGWSAFKRFDICLDGDLYLRRFVLFRCPSWGVYLHHIVRSDRDRALHDHPWPFVSVILWGGYFEETFTDGYARSLGIHVANLDDVGVMDAFRETMKLRSDPDYEGPRLKKWRWPGSIAFRSARTAHRVSVPNRMDGTPRPAWSLVFLGPRQREWGFWDERCWVHWKEFVNRAQPEDRHTTGA